MTSTAAPPAAPLSADPSRASSAVLPGGKRTAFFARFAWGVLGITVAVIAWGGYVRASGSGAGCGRHWPTCNGEVIPRAPAVATMVEYAHRASSGLVVALTAIELVWALRLFARRHRVRKAAGAAMAFMLGEAVIGAGLVLFELVAHDRSLARAFSMGAHLINSFFLLGALALAAFWSTSPAAADSVTAGPPAGRATGDRLPHGAAFAIAILATVVVGSTGAIAALGDTLFPAASLGQGLALDRSPTAHVFIRLRVWHPIAAVLASVYLLSLAGAVVARARDRATGRLALGLIGAVVVQVAVGLTNLALLAPIPLQLMHLVIADTVFILLVLTTAAAFDAH